MELTIFDIIAVSVIGLFAFLGFRKGLVAEVFKILGVVIGIVLALQYMAPGAVMIHSFAQLEPRIEKVLAFIAILLITIMVFIYLAKIAKLIFKMALMGWLDRGGGLLFGGLKGALIISSFMPLFLILPDSIAFVKETRNDSIIYKYLQGFAPKVYDSIALIVPGSESFADKLKSVIPSGGSLSKISAGEVDLESLNMIQQFMGSEDSEMLQELQKQLGDMKIEDMNLNTAQPKEIQDILDKYTKDKKKKKR